MVATSWATSYSEAFWQLILCVFAHIITIALSLMARLTEMSVTPTKPLCNRAAIFTFKLNEVFAVFRTILNWNLAAIRAN